MDTCVWSLALRRKEPEEAAHVRELAELIKEGRALMMGPVRQEVLSGIRESAHFARLRKTLRAFQDLGLTSDDFERAAEHFNTCRKHGAQGSNTDFLICAVAERLRVPVLTTDLDFRHFAAHVPVRLHVPRPEPDATETG